MNKIDDLFMKADKLFQTAHFIVASIAYALTIIFYTVATKELVKPSGLTQAIDFLFRRPEDYIFALILGIGASVLTIVFLLAAVISIVSLIFGNSDMEIGEAVIKIIIAVGLTIAGIVLLKGFVAILGLAIVLVIILFGLIDNN